MSEALLSSSYITDTSNKSSIDIYNTSMHLDIPYGESSATLSKIVSFDQSPLAIIFIGNNSFFDSFHSAAILNGKSTSFNFIVGGNRKANVTLSWNDKTKLNIKIIVTTAGYAADYEITIISFY